MAGKAEKKKITVRGKQGSGIPEKNKKKGDDAVTLAKPKEKRSSKAIQLAKEMKGRTREVDGNRQERAAAQGKRPRFSMAPGKEELCQKSQPAEAEKEVRRDYSRSQKKKDKQKGEEKRDTKS